MNDGMLPRAQCQTIGALCKQLAKQGGQIVFGTRHSHDALAVQRKGQRRESSAAGGGGFVSERIGWLTFAGPSGCWALPGRTGPLLARTAVRHNKLVIRIRATPHKTLWTLRFC